jgi:peptide deformylase
MGMLLKILQVGDEALRHQAKRLSIADIQKPETQQLIDLMVTTLRDVPGVGLAAPQVGEPL